MQLAFIIDEINKIEIEIETNKVESCVVEY